MFSPKGWRQSPLSYHYGGAFPIIADHCCLVDVSIDKPHLKQIEQHFCLQTEFKQRKIILKLVTSRSRAFIL